MSTPFQNRLVGTIIVAAVAIIFLPDVLDGDKKTYQDNFETIPHAPQVDFPAANKRFPEGKLASLPQESVSDERALDDVNEIETGQALNETNASVSTLPKESSLATKQTTEKIKKTANNNTKNTPSKAVLKQAWVIQLGSFRHKNNVDDLVSKLKKAGYTAFTKPIKTKNGNLTKVLLALS